MRVVSKISKAFMWITLGIYLLMQVGAVYGISIKNARLLAANKPDKMYNAIPLICVSIVMVIAVILFTALKRKRYIGFLIAVIASVAMLVIALDLGRHFPVVVSGYETDSGLSLWKLIMRHIGIAIVPMLMIPAWLFERAAEKSEALARSMAGKSGYDLSGEAVFTDVDSTGSEHPIAVHPLKRSLRKRKQ